jgi:hypothetical protein
MTPAIFAPIVAAAAWPGVPTATPPKPGHGGPPPAWIESTTESRWLAYGSYCWTTHCADYEPPALRSDIPVVRAARATILRLHFAFAPRTIYVGYIREGAPPQPLPPARIVTWRPSSSGRFEVQIRATNGSSSYIGAVRLAH